MSTANLLVELFVEELPPKALKKLGESFAQSLLQSLQTQGLLNAGSAVTAYASPRRLAAHITAVSAQAADKPLAQKLMPVGVGLDASGNASPALLKKLTALGLDAAVVPQLRREFDGKADVLYFDSIATGVILADGLQKALEAALAALPIPKVMGYQLADGWQTVHFVRPAHGLVALHGADVVPLSVLGLSSGRETHGHRFEASVDPVVLQNADSYAAQLASEGAVIASFAERRAEIVKQLAAVAANAGDKLKPIDDDALLDEVTALVERPNVVLGQFEQEFLAVPQECLILTMKANQKYFPLLDQAGKLSNKFLIVSNISPLDASAVVGGNERVVRPRLADAKFFFDQDRKKTLASRVEGLSKVVYHNRLGSQGDRIHRVQLIANALVSLLAMEEGHYRFFPNAKQIEDNHAELAAVGRAAKLVAEIAKTDLVTDMVGEFPELQGIMGRYYALNDGLGETVADAVEDHYKPRFAGDSLPRNKVGVIVALADKLETLTGMFGIGQIPTGDKDPFALRRHALGVIRMIVEQDLPLALDEIMRLTSRAFDLVPGFEPPTKLLPEFIYDRLSGVLREQGYSAQEIDAVLSKRPQRLADVVKRIAAVRAFAALPEAAALAAANKRIVNILKKVETTPGEVNAALLQEEAEKALYAQLASVEPDATAKLEKADYTGALTALAALRTAVDNFFDGVMVNADDPALRNNRLALLAKLAALLNGVADISKLSA